jgi:hypothetical protein
MAVEPIRVALVIEFAPVRMPGNSGIRRLDVSKNF